MVNGKKSVVLRHTWGPLFTTFPTLEFCKSTINTSQVSAFIPNATPSFGPNTFPAHNSALFACEVQIEYIARELIAPLIDGRSSIIEVKATAEDQWVNEIQGQLQGSVFAAGCSNWYINDFGRNAASWPGYASTFWKETLIPRWGILVKSGGSRLWLFNRLKRGVRSVNSFAFLAIVLLSFTGIARKNPGLFERAAQSLRQLRA